MMAFSGLKKAGLVALLSLVSQAAGMASDSEDAVSTSRASMFDNITINQDYISLQFSSDEVALDVLVSDDYPEPKTYESFIEKAKEKYGDKLIFVTNSTFWQIGGIEKDGERLSPRNSGIDKGEVYLVYSLDEGLSFIDPGEYVDYTPDFMIPGFILLIKDGEKVSPDNYNHRGAITPTESRRRGALSITTEKVTTEKGEEEINGLHIYFSFGTLERFTNKLVENVKETAFKLKATGNLDGGGESFLWGNFTPEDTDGKYYREPQKKNPESNAVLVGYKK